MVAHYPHEHVDPDGTKTMGELGQVLADPTPEQDADTIIFVYRDEYYLGRIKPESGPELMDWQAKMDAAKGKVEFIVAKNKFGGRNLVARYRMDFAHYKLLPPGVNPEYY